jgi:ribose transport system substrate-binding protein
VPITFGGTTNIGAYWRDNPKTWDKGFIYFPTLGDTNVGWDAMMRTLQGQGPKMVSMARPPVTVSFSDLSEILAAGATTDSTEWLDPPAGQWWTANDIDGFFQKPADPLAFGQ